MKQDGMANVSRLPGQCIHVVRNLIKGFDSAMRFMFPPEDKQDLTLFCALTLAPVFFLGWNFWLMMGVLLALICLNTVRYYLFYDIVDGTLVPKSNRPSSLT